VRILKKLLSSRYIKKILIDTYLIFVFANTKMLPYKYCSDDADKDFIEYGFRLHRIGDAMCMQKFNMISQTYDLVNFFFNTLKNQDRDAIMRNLEKVHLLLYRLNDYPDLLKEEEYKDLIFNNQYILVGWTLIEEYGNHVRIYMFEVFIKGHNFDELLLEKLNKVYYIYNPIDFDYWCKLGAFDEMFKSWQNIFDNESSDPQNIIVRFKDFLFDELGWSQKSFKRYIEFIL
jgi:hypothetical protein